MWCGLLWSPRLLYTYHAVNFNQLHNSLHQFNFNYSVQYTGTLCDGFVDYKCINYDSNTTKFL